MPQAKRFPLKINTLSKKDMHAVLMNFRGGKVVNEGLERARKISKSHTSLTGVLVSVKDELFKTFESDLERDYLIILDFDSMVSSFYDQPVKIPYQLPSGRVGHYTPDILVYYRDNPINKQKTPPLLAEIKSLKDLRLNKDEYALKFAAAGKYAEQRGWKFQVLTEENIRTPYLFNAKFLRQYRLWEPPCNDSALLHEILNEEGIMTVQNLLDRAAEKKSSDPHMFEPVPITDLKAKAALLSTIWYYVFQGVFETDLQKKISMSAPLWHYSREIPEIT